MIPPKTDPRWRQIVLSKETPNFTALPAKLLMMRIRLLARDGTANKIEEAIDVAYDFFSQNEHMIKPDIELLLKMSTGVPVRKSMQTVAQAAKLILAGKKLLLAGSENSLSKLPAGSWIGGTIPYFMTEDGGIISQELIHTTVLTEEIVCCEIRTYDVSQLDTIPKNYRTNGFNHIIIPAFSEAHQSFAKNCSKWHGIFNQPLVGWISGTEASTIKSSTPKVFNGLTKEALDNKAIVMHVELNKGTVARANIINLFEQGAGDTISFRGEGFETSECLVNGKEVNFADYIDRLKIDMQLPLVANYLGAMINVSFRDVDPKTKKVRFLAPVFPGVEYKIAKPIGNYETEFEKEILKHPTEPFFACNCVLNFIYAKLEGKKTGPILGPMTFGEIAYMLLNQTLVYFTLEKEA